MKTKFEIMRSNRYAEEKKKKFLSQQKAILESEAAFVLADYKARKSMMDMAGRNLVKGSR